MRPNLKAAIIAAKTSNKDDKREPMNEHKTYRMFGKKIEKDVSRELNDDGTYTRRKTKLVSYKNGNPVTLKEKERVMIDEPGNIETIVSNKVKKTSFLGDEDTQVKTKEQNYPSNMKMYLENKAYSEKMEEEKKLKKKGR
jgi:hypothetical protein